MAGREDLSNPTFLALLASMIGCLVASFPRKPRQHLKAQQKRNQFPNSMSLVERCHKVTVDARGPGYLDKEMTVYDAVVSYLQGLTAAYTFNWRLCKLYLGECLTISRILGLHRSSHYPNAFPPNVERMKGPTSRGPEPGVDYITQEMGRRTYWVMFIGVKSMQQMGASYGDLFIPPATNAEPYPPLPTEVDDAYIYPSHILPQPPGLISEIVGFNANVSIFCTYNSLSAMELAYGVDEVFDWVHQRRVLETCLRTVKTALNNVPPELTLRPDSRTGGFGSNLYNQENDYRSAQVQDFTGATAYSDIGTGEAISSRRRLQCEIQKANIYASQLGTRSHIVEKYWNLFDVHKRSATGSADGSTKGSPRLAAQVLDTALQGPMAGGNTSTQADPTEADFSAERESIVKDLLTVLGTISQVNMEPNGGSFVRSCLFLLFPPPSLAMPSSMLCFLDTFTFSLERFFKDDVTEFEFRIQINKVRQIASTLLDASRTRKGALAIRAEEYLQAFLEVLMKLERTGPGNPADMGGAPPGASTAPPAPNTTTAPRVGGPSGFGSYALERRNENGELVIGSEEDEEMEFRHWADLSRYQERFAKAGGVLSEI
jgi:hypothetical protein